MRSITITSFLICVSFNLFAENRSANYEVFNTRSGLSNNTVLSITQDNDGLLWIGTMNGLCLYDGWNFDVRKGLFKDGEGEWSNAVSFMFKDNNGRIWLGTLNGHVGIFDKRTDTTIPYTGDFGYREYVTAGCNAADGGVWFATNSGGLYQADMQRRRLIKRAFIAEKGYSFITILREDAAGNVWIDERYRFSPKKKKTNTGTNSAPASYATFGQNRVSIYKPGGREFNIDEHEILSKRHHSHYLTNTGRLFLATTQLIKEYDTDGRLLNRLVINEDQDNNNEDVTSFIFEDASGILWLGTYRGLVKIDKDKYRFTKFATGNINGKLNSNYVRAVFADSAQQIWVGYKAGLVSRLIQSPDATKFISSSWQYDNPWEFAAAVNVIRRLRSGLLLFGGAYGLSYASEKDPVIRPYMIKKAGKNIKLSEVWTILEDRRGRIWVGTKSQGLYIINAATRDYRHYPYAHTLNKPGGLSSVWKVYEDHKGDIWLCTENGLDSVVMSPQGYPQDIYSINDHYAGNSGRQVWSLTEDNRHRLWMSTTINGFSLVDKEARRFVTFNQNNGLNGNVVSGMLADPKGYLWLSTLNGISRFDVKTHEFFHLTENDGLPGSNFNFNACWRTADGHLLFGSTSGVVMFHPDSIGKRDENVPPVLLRHLKIGGDDLVTDPDPSQPIALPYNRNTFSVRFVLPHYGASGGHSYRYMLSGFDERWITTDARHPVAAYTNLPPGKYTLLARGTLDGKKWGPLTRMKIDIEPAIWQRTSSRIAAAFTLLLATAFFISRRFRRSVAREREKLHLDQKFAELELRALQAQMNPHFIFNSINAIQHFMLNNDERSANAYLAKFARLMRLYLESSKNKYIAITEEIELLQLYVHLEKLRFEDKFNYTFTVDPYFRHTSIEIPSMLLQPYVENAINHGLALRKTYGHLHISFSRSATGISCVIDDDGVGRSYTAAKNSSHRSRGMDIISERLGAFRLVDNIEIKTQVIDKIDDNGNAIGTRVEVFIPVKFD